MNTLDNLQPATVFAYFKDICNIPHGSGNTKAISDYCVNFAKEHGLWFRQDESGNVIAKGIVNYNSNEIISNMNELIMMNHEKTHTFRTLACVLAMQKLFSIYYFASGTDFNDSHIDEYDTAYYDILNVQCLSTENTTFYLSGMEATRLEKIKYILF
mgnify:CR=1 FL=1